MRLCPLCRFKLGQVCRDGQSNIIFGGIHFGILTSPIALRSLRLQFELRKIFLILLFCSAALGLPGSIPRDGGIDEISIHGSAGRRASFGFGYGVFGENFTWQPDGQLASVFGPTGESDYQWTTAGMLISRVLTAPVGGSMARSTVITSRVEVQAFFGSTQGAPACRQAGPHPVRPRRLVTVNGRPVEPNWTTWLRGKGITDCLVPPASLAFRSGKSQWRSAIGQENKPANPPSPRSGRRRPPKSLVAEPGRNKIAKMTLAQEQQFSVKGGASKGPFPHQIQDRPWRD